LAAERIRDVRGRGLPVRGDYIDTDRIIPARFLKSVSFEGLERHLFEDEPGNAVANPAYAPACVMLVHANFGCGSSREHAPQAIRRRGIRAVVGQSFSEIFFGNSLALGMPCPTAPREALDTLMALVERDPSAEFVVDLDAMRVRGGGHEFPLTLPPAARDALLSGSWDATGLLLDDYDQVREVAARLPYIAATGF
jgi:3-isopropylmalate/(R)-2-methylmalate dehydratase small subunit